MLGLPFVATVFLRFTTRPCFPGKARFSLPSCTGGMFCGGGTTSQLTWETSKIRFFVFLFPRLDVLKANVQHNLE